VHEAGTLGPGARAGMRRARRAARVAGAGLDRARGARWAISVAAVSIFSAGTSTGRKGPAGGSFWRGS
jgi:hypothetical protein